MADAKISQLPVATTPLAGTELVPVVQGGVTVQTTVGDVLTGAVPSGTANGVLYLNGSKVVTSGSALTFDGLTLLNNQGSSGTSIAGNALFGLQGASNSVISFNVPDANAAGLFFGYGGNPYWAGIEKDGSTGLKLVSGGSTLFTIAGSEQMRLTSTGLGIGTSSPGYKLDVNGTSRFSGVIGVGTTPANYGGQIDIYTNSDSANNGIWVRNDNAGSSAKAGIVLNASGNSWRMSMGSVANNSNALTWEKDISGALSTLMTLDTSGNLGLGAVPSASTRGKGFDIGLSGGLYGDGITVNHSTHLTSNAYPLANGSWIYKNSSQVAQLYSMQSDGSHLWYTAPSGTAGNAISFTQALTLDANRNLLLNGTSAGASAVGTLAIFNGTAPTGSVTDGIILYAEDVSSSSELKVRDEAGNVTTLSPHNFSLIPEGPSEDMAWAYYSEKDGKRINVDMLKLARMVEKLTGEKLVYSA